MASNGNPYIESLNRGRNSASEFFNTFPERNTDRGFGFASVGYNPFSQPPPPSATQQPRYVKKAMDKNEIQVTDTTVCGDEGPPRKKAKLQLQEEGHESGESDKKEEDVLPDDEMERVNMLKEMVEKEWPDSKWKTIADLYITTYHEWAFATEIRYRWTKKYEGEDAAQALVDQGKVEIASHPEDCASALSSSICSLDSLDSPDYSPAGLEEAERDEAVEGDEEHEGQEDLEEDEERRG